jgi:ribosome-binding factor A
MNEVKKAKFNSLVQEALGEIINREIEFPVDVFVGISRVEATGDLSVARVFVECFPEEKKEAAIKILHDKSDLIRKELAGQIKFRRVPRIVFFLDEENILGEESQRKIEEILERIKKEEGDRKVGPPAGGVGP